MEDDSFMSIIKDSVAKPLRLTLYSTKTHSSRGAVHAFDVLLWYATHWSDDWCGDSDVVITPSRDWGGPGTLGGSFLPSPARARITACIGAVQL
jgi:hypothetical protein